MKPRRTSVERIKDKIAKQSNVLVFAKSSKSIEVREVHTQPEIHSTRKELDSCHIKAHSGLISTQETSGAAIPDPKTAQKPANTGVDSDVDDSMTDGAHLECKRVLATKLRGNMNPFGGGVKQQTSINLHARNSQVGKGTVGTASGQDHQGIGFSLARKLEMLDKRFPVKLTGPSALTDNKKQQQPYATAPTYRIPCLYFPSPDSELLQQSLSRVLFIYLHGNAEDLIDGSAVPMLINSHFNTNVLMMEFAGYSLYKDREPSENQIQKDLETVFDYALNTLGFTRNLIILVGRSIGSGPAVHVASQLSIGGLVLISPFTSIKNVAQNVPIVGKIAGMLVNERFDNKSKVQNIKCRFLIIHGQLDLSYLD